MGAPATTPKAAPKPPQENTTKAAPVNEELDLNVGEPEASDAEVAPPAADDAPGLSPAPASAQAAPKPAKMSAPAPATTPKAAPKPPQEIVAEGLVRCRVTDTSIICHGHLYAVGHVGLFSAEDQASAPQVLVPVHETAAALRCPKREGFIECIVTGTAVNADGKHYPVGHVGYFAKADVNSAPGVLVPVE